LTSKTGYVYNSRTSVLLSSINNSNKRDSVLDFPLLVLAQETSPSVSLPINEEGGG